MESVLEFGVNIGGCGGLEAEELGRESCLLLSLGVDAAKDWLTVEGCVHEFTDPGREEFEALDCDRELDSEIGVKYEEDWPA